MQIRGSVWVLAVLLFPAVMFGQKPEDAAKERARMRAALIEQAAAEARDLKLDENRAVIGVRIGNLLWQSDEKRARAMFQGAATDLANGQAMADAVQRRTGNQNEQSTLATARNQILSTIGGRDADLALELMVKTRPAAVAKALLMMAAQGKKNGAMGNSYYLAQNEINLEQSLIRMAADQNPERSVALIKDAIAKQITGETLNLLKKLATKDPETAKDLAARAVDQLLSGDLTAGGQPNYQKIQNAINFLNDHLRERPADETSFRFDDSQMRSLGQKLFAYFLAAPGGQGGYISYSIIPIAEKMSPSIVEQLKKIAKATPSRGDWGGGYDVDVQKFFNGDPSADKLLAEASKFPEATRMSFYQRAVGKLTQEGNVAGATAVINEYYAEDQRDDAMLNMSSQYSYYLINQGRFAEAERIIDELPDNTRFSSLANLANSIYQKDPAENRTYALAVIGKMRSALPEKPENNGDLERYMQVINAYMNIDANEAFGIYAQLVPLMNELADAAAVIGPFQGTMNVRNGEFLISQGNNFGFYGADMSVMSTFARKDIDETVKLADQFTRREIRITLKLMLAETLN